MFHHLKGMTAEGVEHITVRSENSILLPLKEQEGRTLHEVDKKKKEGRETEVTTG